MENILFVIRVNQKLNPMGLELFLSWQREYAVQLDYIVVSSEPLSTDLDHPPLEFIQSGIHSNLFESVHRSLKNYLHPYVFFMDDSFELNINYLHALKAMLLSSKQLASVRGVVQTMLQKTSLQENFAIFGKDLCEFYDISFSRTQRFNMKGPNFVLANYLLGSLFRLNAITNLLQEGFEPLPLKYFVGADLGFILQNRDYNHYVLPNVHIKRKVNSKYQLFLDKIAKHLRFQDEVLLKSVYAQSWKQKTALHLFKIQSIFQNPDLHLDLQHSKKNLLNLQKSVNFRHQCLNSLAQINSFELDRHCLLLIE